MCELFFEEVAEFVGLDLVVEGFGDYGAEAVADEVESLGAAAGRGFGGDGESGAADGDEDALRLQIAVRTRDGVGIDG